MWFYRRMFFIFTLICSFVGIFYYTLLQSGYLRLNTPTLQFNNLLSVTGVLSFSQQRYGEGEGRHYSLESQQINEDLERYTLGKPSKEKLERLSGNALEEKFFRNDERHLTRLMDGEIMSNDGIFRKSGTLSKHLPNVIIIGVKKGGTRALLEILKLHPEVCTCGPEMHFFDRHYDKGISWYREHMPLCYENEVVLEKTPSYFVTSGVERDVYNYSTMLKNPLKVLVIVRDPTTRAVSDFTQTQVKRSRTVTFDDMALKTGSDAENTVVNESWSAIKIGVYSKHLRRWLKYFNPQQIHVVSGEALTKDPYTEIKPVEKFLNLTPFITPQHFIYNETKKFYCFDRNLSRVQNLSGATPEPLPLRCLGTTKGRSHIEISPNTEKALRRYYAPFNEELYEITGRNFEWK